MEQSLYNQAIEARNTHAVRSCNEGYELSVVADRYWDDTVEMLTIHYDRNYMPLCYTLTHLRPANIILTGTDAKIGNEEEVFGRMHHVFH